MSMPYSFADAQTLLVKPFDRLGLILTFILASGCAHALSELIISTPNIDELLSENPIQYGIITGLITGLLWGVCQWLVLRKYIPDGKWILIVTVSFTLLSVIQIIDRGQQQEYIYGLMPGTNVAQTVLKAVLIQLSRLVLLWMYGYLQWYVIKSYVKPVSWWVYIPFMAILVGFAFMITGVLLNQFLGSWFGFNISFTQLPATQAIALCCLHRKSGYNSLVLEPPLTEVPDILNYWKTRKLQKDLYVALSRRWKTDLDSSIQKLSYLVGVNQTATEITYQPVDPISAEQVCQTPLPEIASMSSLGAEALEAENATPLAKFQVIFTPPGTLKINSWRGIPLIGLGVTVYSMICIMSYLVGFVLNLLPLKSPFFN
jgi:hypothetical protein